MNLNFNFPDLVPDPSFSFTSPTTRVPVFPSASAQPSPEQQRSPTHHQDVQTDDQARDAASAASALYDERLRRALGGAGGGGEEDLPEQEERVYRAEGNIRNFGYNFLLPPGRRQTQAETEHPGSRSSTPSDGRPPDHRQEDNQQPSAAAGGAAGGGGGGEQSEVLTLGGGGSPGLSAGDPDGDEDGDGEGEGERDLDEEMEDRDVSYASDE